MLGSALALTNLGTTEVSRGHAHLHEWPILPLLLDMVAQNVEGKAMGCYTVSKYILECVVMSFITEEDDPDIVFWTTVALLAVVGALLISGC